MTSPSRILLEETKENFAPFHSPFNWHMIFSQVFILTKSAASKQLREPAGYSINIQHTYYGAFHKKHSGLHSVRDIIRYKGNPWQIIGSFTCDALNSVKEKQNAFVTKEKQGHQFCCLCIWVSVLLLPRYWWKFTFLLPSSDWGSIDITSHSPNLHQGPFRDLVWGLCRGGWARVSVVPTIPHWSSGWFVAPVERGCDTERMWRIYTSLTETERRQQSIRHAGGGDAFLPSAGNKGQSCILQTRETGENPWRQNWCSCHGGWKLGGFYNSFCSNQS